jgi:hypothetical protein
MGGPPWAAQDRAWQVVGNGASSVGCAFDHGAARRRVISRPGWFTHSSVALSLRACGVVGNPAIRGWAEPAGLRCSAWPPVGVRCLVVRLEKGAQFLTEQVGVRSRKQK